MENAADDEAPSQDDTTLSEDDTARKITESEKATDSVEDTGADTGEDEPQAKKSASGSDKGDGVIKTTDSPGATVAGKEPGSDKNRATGPKPKFKAPAEEDVGADDKISKPSLKTTSQSKLLASAALLSLHKPKGDKTAEDLEEKKAREKQENETLAETASISDGTGRGFTGEEERTSSKEERRRTTGNSRGTTAIQRATS